MDAYALYTHVCTKYAADGWVGDPMRRLYILAALEGLADAKETYVERTADAALSRPRHELRARLEHAILYSKGRGGKVDFVRAIEMVDGEMRRFDGVVDGL